MLHARYFDFDISNYGSDYTMFGGCVVQVSNFTNEILSITEFKDVVILDGWGNDFIRIASETTNKDKFICDLIRDHLLRNQFLMKENYIGS